MLLDYASILENNVGVIWWFMWLCENVWRGVLNDVC